MNITAKGRYALKLMMDLAEQGSTTQRQMIAQRQGIPIDYMDHILAKLKEYKLIDSIRGRTGGVFLKKKSDDISVWDIFSAVEDTMYPVRCLDHNGCFHEDHCVSKGVWDEIFDEVKNSLTKKTLSDLIVKWGRGTVAFQIDESHSGFIGVRECKAPQKSSQKEIKQIRNSNKPQGGA